MSGVFGIVRFDDKPVEQCDLDRQKAALAHLGPDQAKTRREDAVGVGSLLMRVMQEDVFDTQPLQDQDLGLLFVSDARIDNREEIAAALALDASALREMPDSVLLFDAFKQWGPDCAERIVGDFVFAVWDAQRKRLTLARDHMGQRHVFYHAGQGIFAFASEIKGLWALPEIPRKLLESSVVKTLLFEDLTSICATGYAGIEAVPGGAILTVSNDGAVGLRRYWEPHADPAHEGRNEAYYVETYRKILGEAVACRLRRAICPAGIFMGGGFDSSAICALAGPIVAGQGRKFVAVSSVMPEDYQGDIRHARKWVEICRHHMPHLDVRYVTRESLDVLIGLERGFRSVDTWRSPNHFVNDAILAEVARAGARIVMDGHGGDYTLNPRGQDALARLLRKGRYRSFIAEFNALRRRLRLSAKRTFLHFVLKPLAPSSWMMAWLRWRAGLPLFGPTLPFSREVLRGRRARPPLGLRAGDSLPTIMQCVLRLQQNLPAQGFSVSGAAHGLEFTQPFHDKRVVEFALAIPEEFALKNGQTRYLARMALKDIYPPEFQDRLPGNDDRVPDFLAMVKRIEPRLLAEIDRMERGGKLSAYFDFKRMRQMLTRRRPDQHASGDELDTQQAILAFLVARYIEWFRGDNA